MLQEPLAAQPRGVPGASEPERCACVLPVDTFRSDDGLTLVVDLPHLDPQSIAVSASGNVVQVSGRRRGVQPEHDQPGLGAVVVRRLFLAEDVPAGALRSTYDGWVVRLFIDGLQTGEGAAAARRS